MSFWLLTETKPVPPRLILAVMAEHRDARENQVLQLMEIACVIYRDIEMVTSSVKVF